MSGLPTSVTVYEVGPRDGLQNEATQIPTEVKRAFVEALAAAGLAWVEATSFVHPKWVPQLADAADLLAGLQRREGTRYPVLTPNAKGLERALESGCDAVAVFIAASEGFSRANTNCTVEESLERVRPVIARAAEAGAWVRGYVSVVWGCPYQGAVPAAEVVRLTKALVDMGCAEVSLGDTIGVATPGEVTAVLEAVTAEVPVERLALHFHDTRGTALANSYAGLQAGVRVFDASAGGLGGCPYAPGAAGNLATEDLLYMLHGLGIETGVDLEAVRSASKAVGEALGKTLPSRYAQAGPLVLKRRRDP